MNGTPALLSSAPHRGFRFVTSSCPAPATGSNLVRAWMSFKAATTSSMEPKPFRVPCTNIAGVWRRGKCSVRNSLGRCGGWSGYPEIPATDYRDLSASPVYNGALPEGIDCQRCHGPGAAHVEGAQTPGTSIPQINALILNPTKLSKPSEGGLRTMPP